MIRTDAQIIEGEKRLKHRTIEEVQVLLQCEKDCRKGLGACRPEISLFPKKGISVGSREKIPNIGVMGTLSEGF